METTYREGYYSALSVVPATTLLNIRFRKPSKIGLVLGRPSNNR